MDGAKDPFDVLGLAPGCTDEDVKIAFRRKAATCHPDSPAVRGDPTAGARFRDVVEARDTLLDAARRKEAERRRSRPKATAANFGGAFDSFFDHIDRHGRGAAPNGGAARPRRGADVERTVNLTLEQAYAGGRFKLSGAPGPCAPCKGTGEVPSAGPVPCEQCGGSGRIRQTHGFITAASECGRCGGAGSVRVSTCSACGGQGRIEGGGATFEVPPGARDGLVNLLRGYGAPGFAGGARGDLRLTYRVRPHALYDREGDDLRVRLRVKVWEAGFGCVREIPGIDGLPVRVEVPAGFGGGETLDFPGRGMPAFPGRGVLKVEVVVEVPSADTPALREAYGLLRDAASAT